MIATNKHSRLWQSCENDYQVLTFQKDWYKWVWLKAVTEPNSVIHTAIAEWTRPESTENDGSVRFSDTGI